MNLRYSARGITLIELLAYMAILIVVTQLISSILLKSTIINEQGNKYIYSLQEVSLLQSTIKKDLREAVEIMPSLNEYKTSDTSIILRTFSAYDPADASQYIIYQMDADANQLKRIVLIDQKTSQAEVWAKEIARKSFTPEFKEVRFMYDNEKDILRARLITVSMVLKKPGSKHIEETIYNFSVKLRAGRWLN